MDNKKRNIFFLVIGIVIISIIFIRIYASADEYANKVDIKDAQITSIQTGSEPFDKTNAAGNDVSSSDRVVRSFDTISYDIKFSIKPKENVDVDDLEDRVVFVTMKLSKEDIKYTDFVYESTNRDIDVTISDDKTTITYPIFDVNTYGDFNKIIKLNVKSAPNGYEINPTFIIKESTDKEDGIVLGKVNDIDYYEYNNGKYSSTSSVSGFTNYMPTVVSSKSSVDVLVVSSNQTEIATLNDKNGRYVTFGLALQLLSDNESKGIKGLQLPKGDITFDIDLSSSNGGPLVVDKDFIRPYTNEKVANITPVAMELPYNPSGDITFTKKSDSTYTITISNYDSSTSNVTSTGNIIDNSRTIFSTFAITAFSQREDSDAKNNIVVTMNANKSNSVIAKSEDDKDLKETTINNNTASIINEYKEESDYFISGTFVDKTNFISLSNRVSKERNYASVTRGDEIAYKSSFNFNNNVLKTGIIQMIKIDPDAYEVIKLNKDNDYLLDITCDEKKCNLSKDDFTIKYITGSFDKNNYEVINYSDETMEGNFLNEDKDTIKNQCLNVKNNYNNLNSDQIMNLYGGPCIKAKSDVEQVYNDIKDINGVKVSKIIIETKDNKVLDSNEKIDFIIGLRVRNIKDITQTHQGLTLVKSKNNKNDIYFEPSVSNDVSSVTNYNNYIKTRYEGTNAIVDDKPYADSLKIVSFSSKNSINITNKKSDGTKKLSYNTKDNETLKYKIDVKIDDNSINVGADDVWYIKSLKVTVLLPNTLIYKENNNYMKPVSVISYGDTTRLIYDLSYTKPNKKIDSIYFDAVFKSDIKGANNEVVVQSTVDAINVNNEVDTSVIGSSSAKETIYVTGVDGIIITEDVGSLGSVIEKNGEFNYNLNIYNNSNEDINSLSIMDILPYNNDELESKYEGSYKVKMILPDSLKNVKVSCYNDEGSKVVKEVDSTLNKWEDCNITNDYINTFAFKIDNIKVLANQNLQPIVLQVKTSNNSYSDKYNNKFYAKSEKLIQTESSQAKVRVVNRTISGQVFVDQNKNGIKDDSLYLKDINVSLCKLDSKNQCKDIDNTMTDENGNYKFDKLDIGRYKVNFMYDNERYDVTDRYFTSDETIDSDAYKVSDEEGKAEISSKTNGIKVTKDVEVQSNLDLGLISKTGFEVDIKKGINKVELYQDGKLTTNDYDFLKTISLSVKNTKNIYAKVYYGFVITNNSDTSGYVSMIEEMLPDGMSFNSSYEENKDWFSVDGSVYSDSLKNDLIKPGEQRTLQIALDMSPRQEAGVFLNQVQIVDLTPYIEQEINREDDEYIINNFEIGSSLSYAGVNFHVINDDGKNVTLLADEDEIATTMSHITSSNDVYKWSTSVINEYINTTWLETNSIDKGILVEQSICDDASGLSNASYGGTLSSEGKCQSGVYNNYRVRLLTTNEFDNLVSKLSNVDWLIGTKNYWTMNSEYVSIIQDEYGNTMNSVANQAILINKTTTPISQVATTKATVRPVITVSKENILLQ